jgi:hypothetical protein
MYAQTTPTENEVTFFYYWNKRHIFYFDKFEYTCNQI